jgi:phosphosulfolactate synthase
MWDSPAFLRLPRREGKPRSTGLTHVLDSGVAVEVVDGLLNHVGELVDVVKVGWGIGYIDRSLKARIALYHSADVLVCLGGTLLEIAAAQGKLGELRRWAAEQGVDALEISNGLGAMAEGRKTDLVAELAEDFVVLAETGAKDGSVPVVPEQWVVEMQADLDAGARWVIAEGRESGTVGLFEPDGRVREELVGLIRDRLPLPQVILEAPQKAQQAWFVRQLGPAVNLGNISPDQVLALETLRLGLRADTARLDAMP